MELMFESAAVLSPCIVAIGWSEQYAISTKGNYLNVDHPVGSQIHWTGLSGVGIRDSLSSVVPSR
jgi:hypothetical protein